MIPDIQHLPALGLSDHVCLKFALTYNGKYIHDSQGTTFIKPILTGCGLCWRLLTGMIR